MEKKTNKTKKILLKTLSVLLALLIWQLISMKVGMELLLASPLEVVKRLFSIWTEPSFFSTVFYSLLRIMSGFFLAFVVGTVFGFLSYRFKAAEILLWPYVITARSVPVASFIILFLFWLTFDQLTVFISFLIAFPVIYSNVLNGLKATSSYMTELAKLYKVSWKNRLIYIYLPQIRPFLISSCSASVGMAWKAGIAAEVIGVVNGFIGERLYDSKIYLLSADLFAWTIIIVILSVILEKLFILCLKTVYKGVVTL